MTRKQLIGDADDVGSFKGARGSGQGGTENEDGRSADEMTREAIAVM
jgi:hypothetical protein